MGPTSASAGQVRRHVVVHGRVQGVFFRAATRDEALIRGVSGWVRNRPDGTVEAVFQGEPQAVAECVAFCRRGPRHARVDRVDVQEETEGEGLRSFRIL